MLGTHQFVQKHKEGVSGNSKWLIILAFLLIGLWFIVILPLGPNLSKLPGDLGDTRFNNFILEHGFRWINGLDPSLWNVPIFFPFIQTLAFSDNHLGSLPVYIIFRWIGLGRESAFQAWYILGYCINFLVAAYVLNRLKLNPLAIAIGAFLFTFGLPVLAQELHQQLLYRFCIPLACFSFWQFTQEPKTSKIASTLSWVIWQFYLSIYLGFFLSILLIAFIVVYPFFNKIPIWRHSFFWLSVFKQSLKSSTRIKNVLYLISSVCLLFLLIFLLRPYAITSATYGFTHTWWGVSELLPRIQSYFISDRSIIWKDLNIYTAGTVTQRQEQHLFIGGSAFIFLIVGLIWRFQSAYKKMAVTYLCAAVLLIVLTIYIDRFSFYVFLWLLPGINGIRAVSRVILVLLWPVALYVAITIDALLHIKKKPILLFTVLMVGFMVTESILYDHYTITKNESMLRIQELKDRIPSILPADPILFIYADPSDDWENIETDAMLLSQDLGWPVMNGYSANFPPGYGPTTSDEQVNTRIKEYMKFINLTDPYYLNNILDRVVILKSTE